MRPSNVRAGFYAALTGVLYGLIAPATVKAYSEGAEVMAMLVLRCGTAAPFFGAIHLLGWTGSTAPDPGIDNVAPPPTGTEVAVRTKQLCAWLIGAAIAQLGFCMCFFTGIMYLPITSATCVVSTYPLIVLVLAAITEPRGNRPGPTAVWMHILAFGGLMLALLGPTAAGEDVTEDEDSVSVSPQPLGYLLVGLSSLSFSVQALCCNRLLRLDIAPIKSAAIVNLIQVGLLGLWYAVATATSADGRGGVFKWAIPTSDVGTVWAWASIVGYSLSQLTLFVAFSTATDASKVTFLQQTDPIVAIILAGVILGEQFFWYQWIGIGIMIASLSVASIWQRKSEKGDMPKITVKQPPVGLAPQLPGIGFAPPSPPPPPGRKVTTV